MSEFIRRRAVEIAEERYPMPAYGPMQQPTRIARDGFVDGMVTMAENMDNIQGKGESLEVLLSQLEKLWERKGRVSSYALAGILIRSGRIDVRQFSVDAPCPECRYPWIVAQTNPDLSIIRTVCSRCDWQEYPSPGVV